MSDNEKNGSNGRSSRGALAVIGAGKMGGSLLAAIAKGDAERFSDLRATVKHSHRAATVSKQLGIKVTTDNCSAVREASVVLLAVKPLYVQEVLQEVRSELREDVVIISIASAVSTQAIESALGRHLAVIRAMPNTPCRIGKGMTTLCSGRFATAEHLAQAASLFEHMGRTAEVDEPMM